MPRVEVVAAGTIVVDIIAVDLPKIAEPGEVVEVAKPIGLYLGGHATNTAIDVVKLGGTAVAVGALGRDIFAEFVRREVARHGVELYAQVVDDVGTARNAILVVRGEDRRFHIYKGANKRLSSAHVESAIERYSPTHLYVSLGVSESVDRGLGRILEVAERYGTRVLLDIAYTVPTALSSFIENLGRGYAAHINTHEARALVGTGDPVEAVKALRGRAPPLLVVTSGGEGVVALLRRRFVIRQPPLRVEAVDPTGAGDAFCAGLMHGSSLRGIDFEAADPHEVAQVLLYAQAAGAAVVSAPGATTGVSKERVEALIEEQGGAVLESTSIEDLGP